jgi:hypothetical protein
LFCENLNPIYKIIDSNKQLIPGIDAFEEPITCLILVLNNVLTWIHERIRLFRRDMWIKITYIHKTIFIWPLYYYY